MGRFQLEQRLNAWGWLNLKEAAGSDRQVGAVVGQKGLCQETALSLLARKAQSCGFLLAGVGPVDLVLREVWLLDGSLVSCPL